jgi:hypothetical protein
MKWIWPKGRECNAEECNARVVVRRSDLATVTKLYIFLFQYFTKSSISSDYVPKFAVPVPLYLPSPEFLDGDGVKVTPDRPKAVLSKH